MASLLLTHHGIDARKKRRRRKRVRKVTIKTSNVVDSETVSINAEARIPIRNSKKSSYKKRTAYKKKKRNYKNYKKKPYTKKGGSYKKYKGKGKGKKGKRKRKVTIRTEAITDSNHKSYYDTYVLAIQWAKSICSVKRCPYNTNNGKVFNIHGLWPNSSRQRMGPFDCKATRVNWRTVDRKLKSELETHWAGLFGSGKEFNAYEWRKHGTCMDPFHGDISKMPTRVAKVIQSWRKLRKTKAELSRRDQRNNSRDPNATKPAKTTDDYEHNLYFKASIALSKTLNLKRNLAKQGIKPGPKRFKLKKLRTAVFRAYNIKNFYVRCDRGRGNRRSEFYVSEIRFCYDLNFKIIECKRKFYTTCNDFVYIK